MKTQENVKRVKRSLKAFSVLSNVTLILYLLTNTWYGWNRTPQSNGEQIWDYIIIGLIILTIGSLLGSFIAYLKLKLELLEVKEESYDGWNLCNHVKPDHEDDVLVLFNYSNTRNQNEMAVAHWDKSANAFIDHHGEAMKNHWEPVYWKSLDEVYNQKIWNNRN